MRLVPSRERSAGEEGFGGPFAEIDGESEAVAVVAGEDHHLFAARMTTEDGVHCFGEVKIRLGFNLPICDTRREKIYA